MTDLVFCYHCRRKHPADEVTLVHNGGVKRWRCRESIFLSQRSTAVRDAFGKTVSQRNRMAGAAPDRKPLPRPVLELFSPRSIESVA